MIGGISFSATSITSGLDADKPANPKPGHQYIAVDTKVLYVCYVAGTWVDSSRVTSGLDADKPVNPRPGNQYLATDTKVLYVCYDAGVWVDTSAITPLSIYGDIHMTSGTDKTLASDGRLYHITTDRTNYTVINQYIVGDIQGFSARKGFYISCEFLEEFFEGVIYWAIKVNGSTKLDGSWTNTNKAWVTRGGPVSEELKQGDVITVGMAISNPGTKTFLCKNYAIKCTPVFVPKLNV